MSHQRIFNHKYMNILLHAMITMICSIMCISSSICRVSNWAIQYPPFVGWPADYKTKLTEMRFAESSVAEASLDDERAFPIQEIIIDKSGILVGKTPQFQVMMLFWLWQRPDSSAYRYHTWRQENVFTNVVKTNYHSSFRRGFQNGDIKPYIFCVPHSQIQSWFFTDISVSEFEAERLPEYEIADNQTSWDNPSTCAINHRVATDFYTPRDQSSLSISDPAAIYHQFIGQVRQTLSLEGGERSSYKSEYEDKKSRHTQGIMLFWCGAVLGITGIFLAIIIAPIHGDAWGFAGLALIPIGLVICYFSAGLFVAHPPPLDPAIIDHVTSGYPTKSAPNRRSSRSSITRTISVIDHSLVVTPAAIAGVT